MLDSLCLTIIEKTTEYSVLKTSLIYYFVLRIKYLLTVFRLKTELKSILNMSINFGMVLVAGGCYKVHIGAVHNIRQHFFCYFDTPAPTCHHFYTNSSSLFPQFLTPPQLKCADVLYERPLTT